MIKSSYYSLKEICKHCEELHNEECIFKQFKEHCPDYNIVKMALEDYMSYEDLKALYEDKIKILEIALDDVSKRLNIVMPKSNGLDWKEHALNQAMGYVNAEHMLEEVKE